MENSRDSEVQVLEGGHSAWLSLRQASRQMGVSPATLRVWADSGRVPSYRTPGGHRRFRIDVGVFAGRESRQDEAARWRVLEHSALGRVRVALDAQSVQGDRFKALPPRARLEHRALGRELIQLLVQALQQTGNEPEARALVLGNAYATLHARYAVKAGLALQMLAFFRDAFVASVIEFAFGVGEPEPERLTLWLNRIHGVIDRVCYAMLESTREDF